MAKMNLLVGSKNIFQNRSCAGFCLPLFTERTPLRSLFYFLNSIAVDYFSHIKRILRKVVPNRIISLYNKFIAVKEKSIEFVSLPKFRVVFIVLAFSALICIRLMAQAFGFSLGYLYLTLICLSGFWFGFRGGVITATISSLIFLAEISIFTDWPLRDVVINSFLLRVCSFYIGGLVMAYFSKIERCLRQMQVLAHYDELTGCANYRWLMKILDNEINRCKRYNKEMAIVMIDLDHFKNINDEYGHIIGNLVLKSFADVVKKNIRNIDIIGRYGGEEFLIILPEANNNDAKMVLDRVRDNLCRGIQLSGSKERLGVSLRFSAGISSFPLNGKTAEELIDVSDRALYQAKRSGRDKIIAERRRWIRVKPAPGLKIKLVKDKKEVAEVVDILNISSHGMLLAFSEDVKGHDIICRIYFPEDEQPLLELKCEIVYKDKTDKGLYLVGIYFEKLPKQVEEKILIHMDKGDYP